MIEKCNGNWLIVLWWTLQRLKSKRAEIRLEAVQSLADEAGPEAATALIATLKDVDGNVRRAAAQALGKRKEAAALSQLMDLMRDAEAAVRGAAADALTGLADQLFQTLDAEEADGH